MTTLVGIFIGIGAVIFAIIQVSQRDVDSINTLADIYINFPAFMIVAGGMLAATLIGHPLSHLVQGFKTFFKVFFKKDGNFALIEEFMAFSDAYRKNGIPGLENRLKKYQKKNLLKEGLTMAVNGHSTDEVKDYLAISASRKYDREMIDYYVFRTMGRTSPAFGMVGTLVGLIFMLNVMGSDPSKIGPFLAVALVTTFYGLIMAHLIFNPMGNKIQHQAELNLRIRKMEMDGVFYILKELHPSYIEDQLLAHSLPVHQKRMSKK